MEYSSSILLTFSPMLPHLIHDCPAATPSCLHKCENIQEQQELCRIFSSNLFFSISLRLSVIFMYEGGWQAGRKWLENGGQRRAGDEVSWQASQANGRQAHEQENMRQRMQMTHMFIMSISITSPSAIHIYNI